jgi:hypothetical protein
VAGLASGGVEPHRVDGVRIAQGLGERVFALGHDDQMYVIGHQAVGPHGEAVAFRVLAKEVEIRAAVVVGVEDIGAAVPPLGDVVGKSRYDDARDAAHGVTTRDTAGKGKLIRSLSPFYSVLLLPEYRIGFAVPVR